MKNLILLISSLAFLFVVPTNTMSAEHNYSAEDSIHLWTSPDLLNLSSSLVSEYVRSNPEAKISVSTSSLSDLDNKINSSGNIALLANDQQSASFDNAKWKMAVGRDIIVPVMNSKNPYREQIYSRGINSADFAHVYTQKEKQNWGGLLNSELTSPIVIYSIDDVSIEARMTEFFQVAPNSLYGSKVENADMMLEKIKNDKYAIGFCRLVNIIDYENNEIKEGLSLIPIDFNNNHKVDYFENIYNNSSDFERGIWIGKYPKVLFSSIYTVANEKPSMNEELAFIEWLVTDGQKYLVTNGYSELVYNERQGKVQSLYAHQVPMVDIQTKPMQSMNIIFVLLIMLGAASLIFLALVFIRNLISPIPEMREEKVSVSSVFGNQSIKVPGGLFFDKSHTWAFMEKDGNVRIGIDDFLQHVTGSITKIRMKLPGETVKKGENFLLLIQNGKHLNIQSPVSGIIKENNVKLNSNSSIINSDPYSDGWIYLIESTNWLKEIKAFLMGEPYKVWIKNEFLRLKDFISSVIKPEEQNQLQFVMQDGGELKDRLLENFGPEIWEEFQTRFINESK